MTFSSNKGFSIIDVILAGAVVAFLVVLTYPLVSDFVMLQNEKEEEDAQARILQAFHVMAQEEKSIELGNNLSVFAANLEDYSSFLQRDIEIDKFNRSRYYRAVSNTEVYRDANMVVHYAVLYSTGEDGCWGKGISCDTTTIDASVTNLLGTNPADYAQKFKDIETPYGDFLIKFTDRDYQRERFKTTTERLDRLTDALTEYGQLKRYQGLAEGVSPTAIFFPPSQGPISDAQMRNMAQDADTDIVSELDAEFTGIFPTGTEPDVIINDDATTSDKQDRRMSMIALARVLGLPDEYCCNAMKFFVDGGELYEEAFFYYSNPRARENPALNTCGPAATSIDDRKLPPRISTEPDPCGK
tara:strand:- start:5464 stop:6534 length:1071 start_codon:yes stop_codon:yes gene_type:complete